MDESFGNHFTALKTRTITLHSTTEAGIWMKFLMLAGCEYISGRQSVKIGDDDFEIFENHNADNANST